MFFSLFYLNLWFDFYFRHQLSIKKWAISSFNWRFQETIEGWFEFCFKSRITEFESSDHIWRDWFSIEIRLSNQSNHRNNRIINQMIWFRSTNRIRSINRIIAAPISPLGNIPKEELDNFIRFIQANMPNQRSVSESQYLEDTRGTQLDPYPGSIRKWTLSNLKKN